MMWFLIAMAYFTIGGLIAVIVAYVKKQDARNHTSEIVDDMALTFFFWPLIVIAFVLGTIIALPILGITWVFERIVKSLPE